MASEFRERFETLQSCGLLHDALSVGAVLRQGTPGQSGCSGAEGRAGVDGLKGPAGPSGSPGGAGVTGLPGHTGTNGNTGMMGERGPSGPRGIKGATGPVGIEGFTGPEGSAGPKGDEEGPNGPHGLDGPGGSTGEEGWTGATGPDGLIGVVGPRGMTGLRGPTGEHGPHGSTGNPGGRGPLGLRGPPGCTGPDGLRGAIGPRGKRGATGLTGLRGSVGITGVGGPQGETGPIGERGIAGPTGPDGLRGARGKKGHTGPDGLTGMPGPVGDTGPIGTKGSSGYRGSTGLDGWTGPRGERGELGFVGPRGPTGPTGPIGSDGEQGSTGPLGPDGEAGSKGVTGWRGVTGPDGLIGAVGRTGPTGLKGPTGDDGAVGLDGVTGDAGAMGPAGDVGPDGIIGPPGADARSADCPTGPEGASGPEGPMQRGPTGPKNNTMLVTNTHTRFNAAKRNAVSVLVRMWPKEKKLTCSGVFIRRRAMDGLTWDAETSSLGDETNTVFILTSANAFRTRSPTNENSFSSGSVLIQYVDADDALRMGQAHLCAIAQNQNLALLQFQRGSDSHEFPKDWSTLKGVELIKDTMELPSEETAVVAISSNRTTQSRTTFCFNNGALQDINGYTNPKATTYLGQVPPHIVTSLSTTNVEEGSPVFALRTNTFVGVVLGQRDDGISKLYRCSHPRILRRSLTDMLASRDRVMFGNGQDPLAATQVPPYPGDLNRAVIPLYLLAPTAKRVASFLKDNSSWDIEPTSTMCEGLVAEAIPYSTDMHHSLHRNKVSVGNSTSDNTSASLLNDSSVSDAEGGGGWTLAKPSFSNGTLIPLTITNIKARITATDKGYLYPFHFFQIILRDRDHVALWQAQTFSQEVPFSKHGIDLSAFTPQKLNTSDMGVFGSLPSWGDVGLNAAFEIRRGIATVPRPSPLGDLDIEDDAETMYNTVYADNQLASTNVLPPTTGAAMVYSTLRDTFYVMGGRTVFFQSGTTLTKFPKKVQRAGASDVDNGNNWLYDGDFLDGKTGLYDHVAMTLRVSTTREVVLVLGGHTEDGGTNVIHSAVINDGTTGRLQWNTESATVPDQRRGIQQSCTAIGDTVYMFGGYTVDAKSNTKEFKSDMQWATWNTDIGYLYAFAPLTFRNTGPCVREGASVCVVNGKDIVVFGGQYTTDGGNIVYLNDVWLAKGVTESPATWVRLSSSTECAGVPGTVPPRSYASIANFQNTLYLWMGQTPSQTPDIDHAENTRVMQLGAVWESNDLGSSWSLSSFQPSQRARVDHAVAQSTSKIVSHGGSFEHMKSDDTIVHLSSNSTFVLNNGESSWKCASHTLFGLSDSNTVATEEFTGVSFAFYTPYYGDGTPPTQLGDEATKRELVSSMQFVDESGRVAETVAVGDSFERYSQHSLTSLAHPGSLIRLAIRPADTTLWKDTDQEQWTIAFRVPSIPRWTVPFTDNRWLTLSYIAVNQSPSRGYRFNDKTLEFRYTRGPNDIAGYTFTLKQMFVDKVRDETMWIRVRAPSAQLVKVNALQETNRENLGPGTFRRWITFAADASMTAGLPAGEYDVDAFVQ